MEEGEEEAGGAWYLRPLPSPPRADVSSCFVVPQELPCGSLIGIDLTIGSPRAISLYLILAAQLRHERGLQDGSKGTCKPPNMTDSIPQRGWVWRSADLCLLPSPSSHCSPPPTQVGLF
eukprot:Sspe_Gene.49306::Locus_26447_Transcript_1_1_Confidence_1.000_Length_370::g.49306::m.49306